tara:strand:+ start:158 stop:436 length:279 start_codon:yes stop_codon:yes gene_type:complete
MKKKKQQIKTFVSVQSLLWFVVFHSKFLTFCCVFGCLASEGLGGKGSLLFINTVRKSDYKNKGVTDTRIITSIVTRRRRKTRKKTKRGRKKT